MYDVTFFLLLSFSHMPLPPLDTAAETTEGTEVNWWTMALNWGETFIYIQMNREAKS